MKTLWTDGSASPNPGPGGFAVIYDGKPVRLGREESSTNIRMEGAAMRAAMQFLDGEEGEIYSDSEFWINVLTKWAPIWQKNGWKKKTGSIKNLNLVKELYGLYCDSKVKLNWVKGHDGIEMNELTDFWANKARENEGLGEVAVELVSTE
ncbi:MAG: ribonuclease H [Candidatus Nanosyncoccus sp.]|jgi:ribonuclease H